jgi:uncharacterized membrane protein YgcG
VITSDVLGALRRRWYLLLLGAIGSLGLVMATLSLVPVTYQAKAMIVLLPPHNLTNTGGNPYLALGGLDSVSGVLSRSMSTEVIAEDVQKVAPGAEFTVEPDATTSGPVLLVTAEADSPAAALAATRKLVDVAPRQMALLQRTSGVDADSFITTSVVTRDARAMPQHKAQIRAVLAIGAASLAATVLGVAWIDGMLLLRRERRRLRIVDEADDDQPLGAPLATADERRRGRGRGKNGRGGPSGGSSGGSNGGSSGGSDQTDRPRDVRTRGRSRRVDKSGRGVAREHRRTRPPNLGMAEGTPG